MDRLTFGILAIWNVGPWQCVDCGNRKLLIRCRDDARREINEHQGEPDEPAPIGNFLRTDQSLVHAISDASRYSEKYRAGVVKKLLSSETTVSRICRELNVSELEIQQWIRAWVESELMRCRQAAAISAPARLAAPADGAEHGAAEDDWLSGDITGPVIESQPIRRPR